MNLSITHSLKLVLAIGAAAAAVLLAACGGDDDSSDSSSAQASESSGAVSVQGIDGTDVLVDSEGRALYTTEAEQGGKVVCTGACTEDWEPLLGSQDDVDSADVDGELGLVERPDGEQQLTLDGLPLYTFTQEGPGQVTGDGFVDEFNGTEFEWQAATTGAASESTEPESSSDDDVGGGYSY